jgi:hypothetical protein
MRVELKAACSALTVRAAQLLQMPKMQFYEVRSSAPNGYTITSALHAMPHERSRASIASIRQIFLIG